jgi:hypothetical protein
LVVRRSACLALLASVFVGGGAAPGWAADPTLDGEVLSQHVFYAGPSDGICTEDPVSNTESYEFEFAGTAGGPYPGTFEASVQVSIEPETDIFSLPVFPDGFISGQSADDFLAAGPLVVVDSQFTIVSSQGLVEGTTELFGVPFDAEHAGVCEVLAGGDPQFNAFGPYKDVRAWDGEYQVTISTAAGDFEDFGFADLQGRQGLICSGQAPSAPGVCPPMTLLVNVNDFGAFFESMRDVDGDGFADVVDNCHDIFNPDQQDTDGSGDGDACDSDDDNDGVADASDACPTTPAATANGCPSTGGAGGGTGGATTGTTGTGSTVGGGASGGGTAIAPKKCVVPKLKGKKLRRAKQLLSKANCASGKITRKKAKKAKRGKVLSTKPATGTRGPKGMKVKLVVGK